MLVLLESLVSVTGFNSSPGSNGIMSSAVSLKEWDEGVNKAVDKYYGSKFDESKTNACHDFVNSTVPNGEDRVKKVAQTLY